MVEKPGLWTRIRNAFAFQENEINQDIKSIRVHYNDLGSSGTQSYSGYPSEEYLSKIRMQQGADIYDQMRRSDPNVVMVLSAVSNLIKGAKWSFQPVDDSDEAMHQAEFLEHVFFNCLDQPWTQKLGEILTYLIYGNAAFEVTHKPFIGHEKFGNYIGLKSMSWRSPRTIDRFNLDPQTGQLLSVTQLAYGDLLRNINIPSEFIVLFTHNREGSMYEGISALRPIYGPWLRKNMYLKLMAIGIEKYAVPTPILDVPEGRESSDQFTQAIEVLQAYTTHQSAYMTKPEGWNLTFSQTGFDPEKLSKAIDMENQEMVRAFMANFMLLGSSSGSGSYALSNDLSDFFLGGIEYIANYISEEISRTVAKSLIDINFGPQESYPQLKATGIRDRAGKELAEVIQLLTSSGVITKGPELEKELRRRYKLPELNEEEITPTSSTITPVTPPETQVPEEPKQLTETIKLADNPRQIIKTHKPDLKELMQSNLKRIGEALKDQILSGFKNLPESKRFDAAKNLTPTGVSQYQAELLDKLAEISFEAMNAARSEVGLKQIKLSEIDEIPPDVMKRIKALAQLLVGTQSDDLIKALSFVYLSNVDSVEGMASLNQVLDEAVTTMVLSPGIDAASGNITAQVVNETRQAIFEDPEIDDEIESFTFKNPDPVSPICQSLNGVTFAKDDPDLAEYRPPLHHNCKSYLSVNLKGSKKPREVTDKSSYMPDVMKNSKYITLAEEQVSGLVVQAIQVSKKIAASMEDARRFVGEFGGKVEQPSETDSFYRFTQLDPGLFIEGSLKSFEPMEGVTIFMGLLRPQTLSEADGFIVQSIVVSKSQAKTLAAAKKIAKDVGAKTLEKVDETDTSYRFRQRDPSEFVDGSFRSKPIEQKGATLIMGQLKK